MADTRYWTTRNLAVTVDGSYCYADSEPNCRRYGRLYSWQAAVQACQALGGRWRLPTDREWRLLSDQFGGASDAGSDSGRTAFRELSEGGRSGFDALLGGSRDGSLGTYARREAHGLYWTGTADGPMTAVYYNFGQSGLALHRQTEGDRARAFSVRCIRD